MKYFQLDCLFDLLEHNIDELYVLRCEQQRKGGYISSSILLSCIQKFLFPMYRIDAPDISIWNVFKARHES